MRKKISTETWAEIRTAYASGLGLRELARNMGISEDTVLGHAKREGWTEQIRNAKTLAPRQRKAPVVAEAAAVTMKERGERHIGRVAGLTDKMLSTFERLSENEQLRFVDELEKLDKIGRRTYGLDAAGAGEQPHVRLRLVAQSSGGASQVAAELDVETGREAVRELPKTAEAAVIQQPAQPVQAVSPTPVMNRPQWTHFKE